MPRRSLTVRSDLSRLLAIPSRVTAQVQQELRTIGLDALGEMIRRAPVDEGTLRGSHSLHVAGERIATGAQMGLPLEPGANPTPLEGGAETGPTSLAIVANTAYAAYQHEHVGLVHPKGGEAKWMERVVAENAAQYRRRLAEAVKRGVEGQ